MNTDKSKRTQGQEPTSAKMPWTNPELIDLDINVATENATSGASASDFGGFTNDYNS